MCFPRGTIVDASAERGMSIFNKERSVAEGVGHYSHAKHLYNTSWFVSLGLSLGQATTVE